ncbi:MAG TPA: class I SAM-dependent methyltransferase [Bacteroidales bacterium]|nr:class I SAM-dependent methyltransferase [Bacteroidales bacterium]
MEFTNAYQDLTRAQSYAQLEFPNTYYLAYRDLPKIIRKYATGKKAIDFGCGTGRSARFLNGLGFETTGIDISAEMVAIAQNTDPNGNYLVIENGKFSQLEQGSYDLILSVFTFDNIPGVKNRISLFDGLKSLLKPGGVGVFLDSTVELYANEWASFSTKDFPENKTARSGDKVKVIMNDVPDRRPVEDIIWTDADYKHIFDVTGFELLETFRPLASWDEPFLWVNETHLAPWVIYVLRK